LAFLLLTYSKTYRKLNELRPCPSLLIIKTSSRKEGNKIGGKLKWERSVRTEHQPV